LYIIDGAVGSKRAVDALDAKSIQSVNVLKGQSAIAEYGEKGKNGVVIVTTKKAANVKASPVQL
jgi:TonB-dependent SusC/RagA subfamily outer membrane receptor